MSVIIEKLLDDLEDQKGISFKDMTKEEAIDKLTYNTNYYKVSCFKKSFSKNRTTGKYINLSFATLYDFSVLDTRLRDVFLKMALDLEHHLKKALIKTLTEAPTIAHRTIPGQFDAYLLSIHTSRRRYQDIFDKILPYTSDVNHYDYPLYIKYKSGVPLSRLQTNFPIWVLMEKMNSNQLEKFLKFYCINSLTDYSSFSHAKNFYKNVNKIRNAAAHNRPFLFDITQSNQIGRVSNFISAKVQLSYPVHSEYIRAIRVVQNRKFHDILSLLYLYDFYVTDKVTKHIRKKDLQNVIHRTKANKYLYRHHPDLKKFFVVFEKLVKDF